MTEMVRKANQYALIGHLIKTAKASNQRLGKKALQKKMHLIQELGGIDAGYRFSFYTYGPYSSLLSGDLDMVASSGGAIITYDSLNNYYLIDTGDNTDMVIESGHEFVKKYHNEIARVLDAFGDRLAKELELTSTIVYLRRHMSEDEFDDNEKLQERVRLLKPKYSIAKIRRAINEVRVFLAE